MREETGVETAFESLLTLRHQHAAQFGRSDLYAICLLRVASPCEIRRDSYELDDARSTPTWLR